MDLLDLVPKDKGDEIRAIALKNYDFTSLKPIHKYLLGCLADLHWPIAKEVAGYLQPHTNELVDEIFILFNELAIEDDFIFTYNIIACLMKDVDYKLDDKIINELIRIRDYPTQYEKEDDLDWIAKETLINQSKL